MPTYEYKCNKCGHFEVCQSIKDNPLSACPTCGGPVQRMISRNVNLLFKGSGFHITDYRSDSYKSQAKADSNGSSSSSSSSKSSTSSTAAS